jgi:hypothetical protein
LWTTTASTNTKCDVKGLPLYVADHHFHSA